MSRINILPGQKWKHFKGGVYEIVTLAWHTETNERLVIYKLPEPDAICYARPATMFLSEVDTDQYPNAKQRYRFELVEE